MQALFDTIPEPNAVTAVIEEPVSTGWWAGVRQTMQNICNAKHIRGCLCPDRGDCGRCVWRLDWREWWGHWGHFPEPFEAQGLDIVDPFSGLDLSYVDGGA